MNNKLRIAIVGAGASGMVAAITAAGYGESVTLFEKTDRVGKKILATGNGKCNLGNLNFSTEQYYCSDKEKLHSMFRIFSTEDTISFFESSGLMIKDKNGYLYPYSEQASAVLDILRMELKEKAVQVISDTEIVSAVYDRRKQVFRLKDAKGKGNAFDRVILACGSPASLKKGEGMSGYRLAESLGHYVTPIVPGLVQLTSDEAFCKALAGVRCQAKVRLLSDKGEIAAEAGEVQFTEYGISGIPVFQISRVAGYALKAGKRINAEIDFFPEQENQAYNLFYKRRYEEQKDRTLEEFLTGTLNKKINMVLIKYCGCKPTMTVKEAGWSKLKELMQSSRAFRIHINGTNPIGNAQVCAGGVAFDEIDTQMQSKLIPGLYFAGELVDVDGKCGGYNLQWAWTSGYIAGRNAAGSSTQNMIVD